MYVSGAFPEARHSVAVQASGRRRVPPTPPPRRRRCVTSSAAVSGPTRTASARPRRWRSEPGGPAAGTGPGGAGQSPLSWSCVATPLPPASKTRLQRTKRVSKTNKSAQWRVQLSGCARPSPWSRRIRFLRWRIHTDCRRPRRRRARGSCPSPPSWVPCSSAAFSSFPPWRSGRPDGGRLSVWVASIRKRGGVTGCRSFASKRWRRARSRASLTPCVTCCWDPAPGTRCPPARSVPLTTPQGRGPQASCGGFDALSLYPGDCHLVPTSLTRPSPGIPWPLSQSPLKSLSWFACMARRHRRAYLARLVASTR